MLLHTHQPCFQGLEVTASLVIRRVIPSLEHRQICSRGQLLVSCAGRNAKRLKYSHPPGRGDPIFVTIERDGSDAWRLDAVVELIKNGGVGILPTDTYPALVCDLENKAAVEKLYTAKGISPKQPLSLLCRNFQDIDEYTQGFPASKLPGQPDTFRLVRQLLPGPFTFILLASKQLPKQCVDYLTGKTKIRRSVGVRMPDDPICQAVLQQLERPLLCSSAHIEGEGLMTDVPEAAVMMDSYSGRGLDFIVDSGQKVAEGSTIVDLTSDQPEVLREGKGDATAFRQMALMAA